MKLKYIFILTMISIFLALLPQLVFSIHQPQQSQTDPQINAYTQTSITTAEGIVYQAAQGALSYTNVTEIEYEGYIVQFKEKPVFVYKKELEERIEEREERLSASHPAYKYTVGLVESVSIGYNKLTLSNKVNKQRSKIKQTHSSFKEYAKKTSIPTGQASAVLSEIISPGEMEVLGEYTDLFNGMALNVSDAEAQSLKELDYVEDVYPNMKVEAFLMDSVPLINADDVWDLGYTGEGVTIAIIDTGIDYTHPDLGGCFGAGCKVVDGYDFVNKDNDPMDDHGHGTHVAGIAASNGNLKGVAPDAKLYAYKVLNSYGSGSFSQVIAGIERTVDPNQDGDYSDHVDVISMSLGGYGNPDDPVSQAVDNAVEIGVVVAVAAGNSGPDEATISSPGTARKAITVGATDKNDVIAEFSSRGPVIWKGGFMIKPDVVAPGVSICAAQWNDAWSSSECFDDEHTAISGTSMATPHVAGAVALLKQAHPDWRPEEIKHALRNTAVDSGYSFNTQGYGRIDTLKAIESLRSPIAFITTKNFMYGDEKIYFEGSAYGEDFVRYELFYSGLDNSDSTEFNWIKFYTSYTEVREGVLYNGLELNEGLYAIKLVVYTTEGGKSQDMTMFYRSDALINQWDYTAHGDILLSDIDNDGRDEIIFFEKTGRREQTIHAINSNGKELDGWPVKINIPAAILLSVGYPPYLSVISAGDVTGDDNKEIVVENLFNQLDPDNCVYVINYKGQIEEGWPQGCNTTDFYPGKGLLAPYQPLILYDVDNDGKEEIIYSIFIYDGNGDVITTFKLETPLMETTGELILTSNPIPMKSTDNNIEFVTVLAHFEKLELYPDLNLSFSYSYYLALFDRSGNYKDGYPKKIDFVDSGLVNPTQMVFVEDINSDGSLDFGRVFIKHSNDFIDFFDRGGKHLTGWPKHLLFYNPSGDTYLETSPLSLVRSDGKEYIILGHGIRDYADWSHSDNITVFDKIGEVIWSKEVGGAAHKQAAIADIDGDGSPDIILQTFNGNSYVWDLNGNEIKILPAFPIGKSESMPVVGDIDGDGKSDIVLYSNGKIFTWSTQGKIKDILWGNYMKNELRNQGMTPPTQLTCTIPSSPNCNVDTNCQCKITLCQNGWLRARTPDKTEFTVYFTSGNIEFNTGSTTGTAKGYISCRDDEREYSVEIEIK